MLFGLERLATVTVPYAPRELLTDEMPSLPVEFEPNTSGMKLAGLPNEEATELNDVLVTGSYDGVSRSAPPSPTDNLVALAAAGRDPADITIPTIGTDASGSGGDDEGEGDDLVTSTTSTSSSSNSTSAATSDVPTTSSSAASGGATSGSTASSSTTSDGTTTTDTAAKPAAANGGAASLQSDGTGTEGGDGDCDGDGDGDGGRAPRAALRRHRRARWPERQPPSTDAHSNADAHSNSDAHSDADAHSNTDTTADARQSPAPAARTLRVLRRGARQADERSAATPRIWTGIYAVATSSTPGRLSSKRPAAHPGLKWSVRCRTRARTEGGVPRREGPKLLLTYPPGHRRSQDTRSVLHGSGISISLNCKTSVRIRLHHARNILPRRLSLTG